MVSRSRQSDSIIAVIKQAALRNQTRTNESWFFMRVDDKTKFSHNCGTLKLKTAEFIGNWFLVILTQLTKISSRIIIYRISFPARKSRFYLCNEVFLDAQIMANTDLEQHRKDQLFVAEIKMPNPSSEGATSTFS